MISTAILFAFLCTNKQQLLRYIIDIGINCNVVQIIEVPTIVDLYILRYGHICYFLVCRVHLFQLGI